MVELSEYERGLVIGLLVGEGSFGGDGRQPQVTLRMHVRHARLFEWLQQRFPRCKLYGPYNHDGRRYYQWMARGAALVQDLLPYLDPDELRLLDDHAADRLASMCDRYADFIARQRAIAG